MNRPSTESLVRQIAGIASPRERAALIEQACAGDDALRERVMSQLDAVERTRSSPVNAAPAKAEVNFPPINRDAEAVTNEHRGDTIGRYRLIHEIGEGGCGTVFLAEQEEPVRRQVALKVIKLGMDTRQVVARFEVERQALAMMDHPNIAKVLDAGATDTGRPFFVMELVRGINITGFCDQNRLTQNERIELFIKVCRAIQHAHQKGVIHRDIKPSNILVSLLDGAPVPKVIDFGIAKAMDESLPRNTLLTPYQAFIGTPAYASPEQADAAGLDVDTRSDIYSLGAVLYELLTGYQPFDQDKFVETGLIGVRRVICETDPLRPSTRLHSLDRAGLAAVARTRRAEPERLPTQMRGDLDWIVMKCLEKDRARRYETANGLAADLKRYLQSEPVTARPPSTTYILQKLMRRHRLVFAAGSAVAASLVIGLAASTRLYLQERAAKREQELLQKEANASARRAGTNAEKARIEAAKSREVSLFMKEMIQSVGPVAMASESTMWRQIVDKAAERIGQQRLHPTVEW
ncbi:MAG: serine/threonine protein kinase [Verrucomicrobia bacterium]|nr:serine/threonine protein kinase [Verrucomicrobiota bacterium]